MPKAMLAATPPRRTSRSSTRKDREILSSCSTTSESANRPVKVIRWSVAMDPVTAILHRTATYRGIGVTVRRPADDRSDGPDRSRPRDARRPAPLQCRGPAVAVRVPGVSRRADGQLKLSPQAQELPALGLSMVKPCFSMVSAKSIVAPLEVGGAHPVDDDLDTVEVARRGHRRGCARRSRAGRSGRSSRRAARRRAGGGRRDPPARAGS